jgi:hypothetical protein
MYFKQKCFLSGVHHRIILVTYWSFLWNISGHLVGQLWFGEWTAYRCDLEITQQNPFISSSSHLFSQNRGPIFLRFPWICVCGLKHGSQMEYFQTKNNNLGRFWVDLQWPFGLFYGHLEYFVALWYILWLFGIFSQFWHVVPRKVWQPWSQTGFGKLFFR